VLRADGNPGANAQDQLQLVEDEEALSLSVQPEGTHCSEAEVMQSIDALEDGALKSFRDGGITNYDVRVVTHAAENARRALVDGKMDPCKVVSDMVRDMMQSDVDGF
jgi:hypothetical protein